MQIRRVCDIEVCITESAIHSKLSVEVPSKFLHFYMVDKMIEMTKLSVFVA